MRAIHRIILAGILFLILGSSVSAFDQVDEEIRDKIYHYGTKGFEFYNVDLDSAEFYLSKAIELQYSTPGYEIDDRVARNHINLAAVYRIFFNRQKALYHLNKAEEIFSVYDPNSPYFGFIYNNKGNLLNEQDDFVQAKKYYDYALDWLEKTGNKNSQVYLEIYSNYIDILLKLSENQAAYQKLNDFHIESSTEPSVRFRFHILKAEILDEFGSTSQAIEELKNAKEILVNYEITAETQKQVLYYLRSAELFLDNNMLPEANRIITEAIYYIESLGTKRSIDKVFYYTSIQYFYAHLLYLEDELDRSLAILDSNIALLNKEFKQIESEEFNTQIFNQFKSHLPETHILRSRVLKSKYEEDGLLEDLKKSFDSYIQSIEILNKSKLGIDNEDSKVYATATILDIYHEAIEVGTALYKASGDPKYMEESFHIVESSKSFVLFSEIKNVEAMEFSDLPSELKNREEELLGEIQGYEGLIYQQQLSEEPDSVLLTNYSDKLFRLRDDYNDLMSEIEDDYSQYFEFKYNPRFVSLEEAQEKLSYKDALIEYVLTDTLLITYVIDKKGINVITQEVDPEFNRECFEYYGLMYTQNFSQGVRENYKRYVDLGRKFYKFLVEPTLQFTERKNLTIVPDGAITYIPFEGLLTMDADKDYINYMNLPYLIRDYSIGYSHSATLMFSERLKRKSPEDKVLAFAPKYVNPLINTDTAVFRQAMNDRDLLLPLGGVIKEVQSINETVPARVFLNEDATEANFKEYASDYNVLHLAMHTIMKDDNPMHSLLAFTNVENPEDTTGEDNKLYAYEIYNLKLNAQMAVLSSCSSGFGKMQKGEGMMSLARGFIYAGCPSIVMTLWQVSDKSSSEMMTSFYKHLKKGKSKQEAMRMAKIEYLESADDLTSNPYFWSGFVVLGDNSPIYKKSGMVYYISIILVFITLLVIFQYRRS